MQYISLLNDPRFLWVMILTTIWDSIWKGAALWNAARSKRHQWFVALFVINSLGILPILYLKFFHKKK